MPNPDIYQSICYNRDMLGFYAEFKIPSDLFQKSIFYRIPYSLRRFCHFGSLGLHLSTFQAFISGRHFLVTDLTTITILSVCFIYCTLNVKKNNQVQVQEIKFRFFQTCSRPQNMWHQRAFLSNSIGLIRHVLPRTADVIVNVHCTPSHLGHGKVYQEFATAQNPHTAHCCQLAAYLLCQTVSPCHMPIKSNM